MKDLLSYILKAIVDEPDKITIDQSSDDTGLVTLTVTVASPDMGKVIGKGGKVINAIRQVVRIAAIKDGKRLNISLQEPAGSQDKPSTVKSEAKIESDQPTELEASDSPKKSDTRPPTQETIPSTEPEESKKSPNS